MGLDGAARSSVTVPRMVCPCPPGLAMSTPAVQVSGRATRGVQLTSAGPPKRSTSRRTDLRGWTLGLTIALGVATLLVGLTDRGWAVAARIAVFACAVGVAATAFAKARIDQRLRADLETEAKSLSSELVAERRRNLTSVNGALLQSVLLVQSLAAMSQNERAHAVDRTRAEIVQTALDLVRCNGPRACYFSVQDALPRRMTPLIHRSRDRTDEPTSVFIEGNGVDQGVWKLVDEAGSLFVEDTSSTAPQDYARRDSRIYKTFISVGVRAGGVSFGMLTINALEPGDLDHLDEATMRVLARLLGATEALGLGTQGMNRRRRG